MFSFLGRGEIEFLAFCFPFCFKKFVSSDTENHCFRIICRSLFIFEIYIWNDFTLEAPTLCPAALNLDFLTGSSELVWLQYWMDLCKSDNNNICPGLSTVFQQISNWNRFYPVCLLYPSLSEAQLVLEQQICGGILNTQNMYSCLNIIVFLFQLYLPFLFRVFQNLRKCLAFWCVAFDMPLSSCSSLNLD